MNNIIELRNRIQQFIDADHLVIHAGSFHADDLFVVAYCQILREHYGIKPLSVLRVTKVNPEYTLDNGYIVADIGGGQFDHHCPEHLKVKRDNDIPYAAFGLIVKYFHYGFLSEEEYERLDEKFIQPIDYHDNYGTGNLLSMCLANFNFSWDEPEEIREKTYQSRFNSTVEICKEILRMQISSVRSLLRARKVAESQVVTGHTVYMEKYAPVGEFYAGNPDIKFVGSPNNRGGYQIICVRDLTGLYKEMLPQEIRGITGGNNRYDILFSSPSGHMAVFKNKEAAQRYITRIGG